MKIEDLENKLKVGNIDALYLFYGEEKFLLESCLKKIKKLFGELISGINYITIDESNVDNLISDLETPAFGFEKKLIIAKNTNLFKKDTKSKKSDNSDLKEKINDFLKENIEIMRQTVVLIFVEETADKCKLYSTIEENGIVCNFEYQKVNQIQARLKSIFNAYEVQIDPSTLLYLIESCGTNMQDLINESRKLIEYAGKCGKVEKTDIDNLCIKKVESIIFDLTDSLGKKNTKDAINILRNLILEKEPVQKIMITLYNHLKKLYLTKIALKLNKDVATSLDLKQNQVFLVNKYKMQASYYKTSELRKILEELCNLDYNYKVGLIDLELGFESILCAYC